MDQFIGQSIHAHQILFASHAGYLIPERASHIQQLRAFALSAAAVVFCETKTIYRVRNLWALPTLGP